MNDFYAPSPYRRALNAEIERQIEEHREGDRLLSLVIINVQHVRHLNISLGYETASDVLGQLVSRIAGVIRESDKLFQLGNAEFALLLPGLRNVSHAHLAVNKILETTRAPFVVDGSGCFVKVILGLALSPEHGCDANTLMRNTDSALLAAKHSRLSYSVYSPQCNRTGGTQAEIEFELAKAIEDGELTFVYQPKVDLARQRVYGVEALVRWDNPTRGTVFPDTFIPVIENSDLVVPFTKWCLNAALHRLSVIQKQGYDLSIAINLSANALVYPDLEESVSRAIRLWGVDPANVVLEVTESALMKDTEKCLATLNALNNAGVVLSIDDFGTGYSSLSYLSRLPVSELKIDKSFVFRMVDSRNHEQIVRSVVDLGHNFNLSVVAEGVEDRTTLEKLRSIGCDYVQGFFIAKPLPDERLMSWLSAWDWQQVESVVKTD